MSSNFYPLYQHGELDADSNAILSKLSKMNIAPLASLPLNRVRETFFEKSWLGIPVPTVLIDTIEIETPQCKLPLRIYTPQGKALFPILVFFHGGGFVVGAASDFDTICSFVAERVSCLVVSVDYRLAPEYKHPAAVEDAEAAINWIGKNGHQIQGDTSRIAVAGDSAGGNLATVSAIIARDKGFPSLIYQVLICPWVDASSFATESYKYFGNGLWLSTESMNWYRNHYLKNEEQRTSYLVSPMLTENLEALPPALIITSEFDVLRDEGEAYAERLKSAGVKVQCTRYAGMLHDFVTLPGLFNKANDAIDEMCTALENAFTD